MSELVPMADTGAVPARPIAASRAAGGNVFGPAFARLRDFTAQPAVQRAMPGVMIAGVIGLAALAWMMIAQPPQRDLFSGLADTEKASVVEALKSAGIAHDIDNATGALTVAEGDYHQAKMLLASQGLPKSAPDGDAMISSLPMGASRAVEDQRLRSARELDLARTIEAIDAVQSARVHLAVEQPSVFLRDRAQPAASVMLQLMPGRALAEGQVRAITHLVGSSVPGLSPEGVSVIDQNGRLLSRAGGDPASEASDRQIDIQQRIEARYVEALTTLLTPLVGAGNFSTEVHADVDFAEVQATRESFPRDTAAVREERGSWTKEGTPDGAGGIPGALANTPPPAAQVQAAPGGAIAAPVAAGAPAAPAPDRTTENYNRTFELGREVSVTRQPVGTVRRLSVAVALKNPEGAKPRSKTEVAAIEQLVRGAVGFDQARGDQIAITARSFAPVEQATTRWWEADWVGPAARNLTALVVALLVIFGIGRLLLKRRAEAVAERARQVQANRQAMKGELATALAGHAAADPSAQVTLDMIEAAPGYAARAELIRSFVRQDPARAALVVRDLIRSDTQPAEARNA